MIRENQHTKNAQESFKTVRYGDEPTSQHIPTSAVLIEHFKTAENRLQAKSFVKNRRNHTIIPLWFLAETERNIYLWQNGFSLGDKDNFEFWIDGPRLIAKRIQQLNHYASDNPFLNPLWGSSTTDKDNIKYENDYLESLGLVLTKIWKHMHVISLLETYLTRKLNPEHQTTIIILPGRSPLTDDTTLN